jgi:hypothetical protein
MAWRVRWVAISIAAITAACLGAYFLIMAAHQGGSSRDSASKPPAATDTVMLPVVACPTDDAYENTSPPRYPAAEAVVLPARLAGKFALYSDRGRLVQPVIGPRGWNCSVFIAVDGGLVVNIFPPGGSAKGPTLVSASRDVACTGCMYSEVCPLVPYATEIFGNQGYACPSGRVPGETVKWLAGPRAYASSGADVISFTDAPDVHGYGPVSGGANPALGLLLFSWDRGSSNVSVISCTVAPSYATVCPVILSYLQQQRWIG